MNFKVASYGFKKGYQLQLFVCLLLLKMQEAEQGAVHGTEINVNRKSVQRLSINGNVCMFNETKTNLTHFKS